MPYNQEIVERVVCKREAVVDQASPECQIERKELLDIQLLGEARNQVVTVILMNPSKANEQEADKTVEKLIQYFHANPLVRTIKLVYLFPMYDPNSNKLHHQLDDIITYRSRKEMKKLIKHNHRVIETAIQASDEVVLGWGNSPEDFPATTYHAQVVRVLKLLRKNDEVSTYIFHMLNNKAKAQTITGDRLLTKAKNPVHPANGEIVKTVQVDIDFLFRIHPKI